MNDFAKTWADPQMRHALIVHWPVVMSVLCAVLSTGLAFNAAKSVLLRWITLTACIVLMVTAYMALQSGSLADNFVGQLTEPADALLEEHEELGEKVPLFGAVAATLVAISFWSYRPARLVAVVLAWLVCCGTAVWVANTAHHGGLLVYEHGVGMPQIAALPSSSASTSAALSGDPRVAFFQSEVHPILTERCTGCHNPQRMRRAGGLDQTSREALLAGGRSGAAIVPGQPEQSLLIQRVRGLVPDEERMPPPPKDPLTEEQIGALERWIRDGAIWATE